MKRIIRWYLLAAVMLVLAGCGNKAELENYVGNDGKSGKTGNGGIGDVIAGLGDEEQWALVDIGEESEVLLVSDSTYDDGNGNNMSAFCEVYYSVDGENYDLGRIESMSTAYPVSYGKKCLYTASNDSFEIYTIDSEKRELVLKTRYQAVYGEDGDDTYYCELDGVKEEISEEEFWESFEIYAKGTAVQFAYGLSDRSWF